MSNSSQLPVAQPSRHGLFKDVASQEEINNTVPPVCANHKDFVEATANVFGDRGSAGCNHCVMIIFTLIWWSCVAFMFLSIKNARSTENFGYYFITFAPLAFVWLIGICAFLQKGTPSSLGLSKFGDNVEVASYLTRLQETRPRIFWEIVCSHTEYDLRTSGFDKQLHTSTRSVETHRASTEYIYGAWTDVSPPIDNLFSGQKMVQVELSSTAVGDENYNEAKKRFIEENKRDSVWDFKEIVDIQGMKPHIWIARDSSSVRPPNQALHWFMLLTVGLFYPYVCIMYMRYGGKTCYTLVKKVQSSTEP
mmetsp:Transcript_40874/g.97146  ORF Transcript_40874/g.97146 Transcript_40874/m.97146 type:complete len:307 (-) Transcript_40874:370-1290(-)